MGAVLVRLGEERMISKKTIPGYSEAVNQYRAELKKKRVKEMSEEEIEQILQTNPIPGLNLKPLN